MAGWLFAAAVPVKVAGATDVLVESEDGLDVADDGVLFDEGVELEPADAASTEVAG